GQGGEIELQRVALVEAEVRPVGKAAVEDGNQVQVQFHHVQVGAAVQQSLGQCALAGTDLNQTFAGAGADGAQDAIDHAHVVQEVLTEAFAGAVLIVGHGQFRSCVSEGRAV